MENKKILASKAGKLHESVLVSEVLEALKIKKGGKYIDATLGNAGHALEILKLGGMVLGIEVDPKMLEIAASRLKKLFSEANYKLVQGNFANIDKIASEKGFLPADAILFDLGVTNLHLKDANRGFSFENPDADLDMRVDPDSQGVKGSDLLNVLREDQLRSMFEVTLEPGSAKWLAGRVISQREDHPIKTVGDFLQICQGLRMRKAGMSQATLPFLALRIAVNSELSNLEEVLPKAYGLLDKGGRLVVISFHSKEDALVKKFFKDCQKKGSKLVTDRPVVPNQEEIYKNKRSRSAKMRVLEK